jgi:hypothetical protein
MQQLARTQPQFLEDGGVLQPCGCDGYSTLPAHLQPNLPDDVIVCGESAHYTLSYIYHPECREGAHPRDAFFRVFITLLPKQEAPFALAA